MNNTLEAYFDAAFAAPHGIKRLRELILTLAVQGKLVEQNPEKGVQNVLSGRYASIDSLAPDFQNGLSKRDASVGQYTTVIRLADITSHQIKLDSTREIRLLDSEQEKYCLLPDDILITRVNGSLDLVGSFVLVRNYPSKLAYCDHFIRMRVAKGKVYPNYLVYMAKSRFVREQVEAKFVTTAGQKTVNQKHIGSIQIPLPPLEEQHRIVAKVDALMARCDSLEAMHKEQEHKRSATRVAVLQGLGEPAAGAEQASTFQDNWQFLQQHFSHLLATKQDVAELRKTILQLAVMGKLVPQNPAEEPASQLLTKIAAEKATLEKEGKIKKQKPLPPVREEEQPYALPAGWVLTSLSSVTQVLNGRAYKQNELLLQGTPVLRVGNLFTSNKWYYSNLSLPEDKYIVNGDLIYAWSASFGPFIWSGDTVIYHYHIWKLKLCEEIVDKKFLYYWLWEKTEGIKRSGNGIAMLHMTKERMEALPLPLPPLAEQHRIVVKLDALMRLCDAVEAQLEAQTATQTRLLDSVMAAV